MAAGTAVFMLEAIVKIHLLNRDRCELIWPSFHKVWAVRTGARELHTRSRSPTLPSPPCCSVPCTGAQSVRTSQHVKGILCPNGNPVTVSSELVERAVVNVLRLAIRILHREDLLSQVSPERAPWAVALVENAC